MIFQNFINNILKKYLDYFMVIYLDDIIIYNKTLEKYMVHV